MNNVKSQVFTLLCQKYSPECVKVFWDKLEEQEFSNIVRVALAKVVEGMDTHNYSACQRPNFTYYKLKVLDGFLTDESFEIAKYIDTLNIDDSAKSVYIKQYAKYPDSTHHEAVKHDMKLFETYLNE